jgi:hypothetical protein
MNKTGDKYIERTAAKLLRSLHGCNGSVPLHWIEFLQTFIQYLLDGKLV